MKLVQMTNKYNYVMYSNHHHEEFASFFGNYVNFNRTNKISKTTKKPAEIMAYKINKLSEAVNNIDIKSTIVATPKRFTIQMMNKLMTDIEQEPANQMIETSANPSDFTA
jgi:hypothetical protein